MSKQRNNLLIEEILHKMCSKSLFHKMWSYLRRENVITTNTQCPKLHVSSHCGKIFGLIFYYFTSQTAFHPCYFRTKCLYIISWEPEGHYQNAMMFRCWKPEGHYRCTKSLAIAPYWFSTELCRIALTPFWFSADDMVIWITNLHWKSTVKPCYNEVLGTMKISLLYQVSHYIRVKKQRNIKSWYQQNYLVIRGFCLYPTSVYRGSTVYTLRSFITILQIKNICQKKGNYFH